jgi:hypothetical protein
MRIDIYFECTIFLLFIKCFGHDGCFEGVESKNNLFDPLEHTTLGDCSFVNSLKILRR